jgi:galactokinase
MTPGAAAVVEAFRSTYASEPRLFQAPGRINIIGEHTDYSAGLVMPAAIDRRCIVAVAGNASHKLRIAARDLSEVAELDLDSLGRRGDWTDYVSGTIESLRRAGCECSGLDMLIQSRVPIGAGLSSSAALEVAVAHAVLALAGRAAGGRQIALWAQQAENDFVGMPCGIMDQFASANGIDGCALLLDCRTLEFEAVALPAHASFLIVNSMVRHAHAGGEYASRRRDCEDAARLMNVPALRDVSPEQFPSRAKGLPEGPCRRARHVIGEIERVRAAGAALRAGDVRRLGELIDKSHESLRVDMEVSIEPVDKLAAIARSVDGVFGARMMGGGFGGCIIALVANEAAQAARTTISARYERMAGLTPEAFICRAAGGAGEIAR